MKRMLAMIVILIIAGLILVIIGCQQQPTVEPVVTPEQEEQIPPAIPEQETIEPIVETQETNEEITIIETAREEAPNELLTSLRCIDNKIEGVVTNTLDETMDLSKAIVHINGILNRNIQCDIYKLEPGESTFCENFISNIKPKTKNANNFNFRVSGLQFIDMVNCEEPEE